MKRIKTAASASHWQVFSLLIGLFLLIGFVNNLYADPLLINIDGRQQTSLNGRWHAIVDPYENGYYDYRYKPKEHGYFENRKAQSKSDLVEYNFDESDPLNVPGDWNTQRDNLFFYEGTIWYKKSFTYQMKPNRRLFLYFGAANYKAIVYLNGEKLGTHTGGFTPFDFEITRKVKPGENVVILKVDNVRERAGVPTLNTDWWNYGGITRRVMLLETPTTYIRDYAVHLDPDNPRQVTGWVQLDGTDLEQSAQVTIQETNLTKRFRTDKDGYAKFSFPANLERWSPENPKLYDVRVVTGTDTVTDQIGFRTIKTEGQQILLNGKPIFLRGVCIHEEAPFRTGRANRPQDDRTLLSWAKELGCNFVRLAHYPHNEFMTREADKMGLLVWSEIPVYWTILWENEDTYNLAEQQLSEMITRDKNRASVIVWSVANETPRSGPRLKFLRGLIDKAHSMDPTRLVTAATELTYHGNQVSVDDPLGKYLDVIGANEYLGWYGGTPEQIPEYNWNTEYDKPLVISEFGAGALQGFHADADTRWSEEYQVAVYKNQLTMLQKIKFLQGMTPWILMDFRSPRRPLPNIQDFWNRKGLISPQGIKKDAFKVLQKYYQEKEEGTQ